MSDYYPSPTIIFIIFFCVFWFYKGNPPFSFWWLVFVGVIDVLIATLMLNISKKVLRRD